MTTKAAFTHERESDTLHENHNVKFQIDGRSLVLIHKVNITAKESEIDLEYEVRLNDIDNLKNLRELLRKLFEDATVS